MRVNQTTSQVDYYNQGKFKSLKTHISRKLDIVNIYIKNIVGKRILDVGCYTGDMTFYFRKLGADAIGVDISYLSLLKARSKGCRVVENDVSDGLAFADEVFDVVYCSEIIEHILDTDFLLREIYRVLKFGGYALISTPNICALRNRIKVIFGGYPYNAEYRIGGAGHIRIYNANALSNQMKSIGFRDMDCIGVNIIPWKLCKRYHILYKINNLLSKRFTNLCLNIVAIGKK